SSNWGLMCLPFSTKWLPRVWHPTSGPEVCPLNSPLSQTALSSRLRCCQLKNTCMAAESISCTIPAPQRLTVELRICTFDVIAWPSAKVPPVAISASQLSSFLPLNVRFRHSPVNSPLYCPPWPYSTVAPSGVQVRLIPPFIYHTSVSVLTVREVSSVPSTLGTPNSPIAPAVSTRGPVSMLLGVPLFCSC